MRFAFVDRIVAIELHRRIETVKHVRDLDDVFADHFPGYPVLPGALVIESFAQASELLIGLSHHFAEVGRLRGLSRVAFRHQVRPDDRLTIRCERRAGETPWVLDATALAGGRRVAMATLEYALEPVKPGLDGARLRAFARELSRVPVEVDTGGSDE